MPGGRPGILSKSCGILDALVPKEHLNLSNLPCIIRSEISNVDAGSRCAMGLKCSSTNRCTRMSIRADPIGMPLRRTLSENSIRSSPLAHLRLQVAALAWSVHLLRISSSRRSHPAPRQPSTLSRKRHYQAYRGTSASITHNDNIITLS